MQSANDNNTTTYTFEECFMHFNEAAYNIAEAYIENSYFQEVGNYYHDKELISLDETIFLEFLKNFENLFHQTFEAEITYALKLKSLQSFLLDIEKINTQDQTLFLNIFSIIQTEIDANHTDVKEIYDASLKAQDTPVYDSIIQNYRGFYMNMKPRSHITNLSNSAANVKTLNTICFDLNTAAGSAFTNQTEVMMRHSGMLYKMHEAKIGEGFMLNTGHTVNIETLKNMSEKINNRLERTFFFLKNLGDSIEPIFPKNVHQYPFNKKLVLP